MIRGKRIDLPITAQMSLSPPTPKKIQVAIASFALLMGYFCSANAQNFTQEDMIVHSDTEAFFRRVMKETPPRKLLERKKDLRARQREGYARTLTELSAGDALMALIAFVKTSLIVDYSISHVPVAVDIAADELSRSDSINAVVNPYQPILPQFPHQPNMAAFNLNYRFPQDPWRKE
jgi:hypothetical protein